MQCSSVIVRFLIGDENALGMQFDSVNHDDFWEQRPVQRNLIQVDVVKSRLTDFNAVIRRNFPEIRC